MSADDTRPERSDDDLDVRPGVTEAGPQPEFEADTESGATDDGDAHAVSQAAGRAPLSLRARLAVATVCLLLGLGVAVQVRLTSDDERDLRGARQQDLVTILDDLDSEKDRLEAEIAELEATKGELSSGEDAAAAAQQEAQSQADALAILAGTVGATGPGVSITITMGAPGQQLPAEVLVGLVQELRAAGAEAIQVGPVRIGLDSAITEDDGAARIDGQSLSYPLTVLAIGEPQTLAAAMDIPGGVVSSVQYAGGTATVQTSDAIDITALRALNEADYAEPADPGD